MNYLDLRAIASDLCMCDAMPFQQHFEFRTTHPLADIVHDKFFSAVSHLRVGDQITMCRYDRVDAHHRAAKLLEIGTVRVVEKDKDTTRIDLHGKIQKIAPVKTDAPAVEPAHEEFIHGSGAAKWNVGRRGYEVIVDGQIVAFTANKEDAQAMARGDIPLPVESEAA